MHTALRGPDDVDIDQVVGDELGASAREGDDPGAARDDAITGQSGQTGQRKSNTVDIGSASSPAHVVGVAQTSAGTESGTGASGPGTGVRFFSRSHVTCAMVLI